MSSFKKELYEKEQRIKAAKKKELENNPCYKCYWSQYLEIIIYCPFPSCIKKVIE